MTETLWLLLVIAIVAFVLPLPLLIGRHSSPIKANIRRVDEWCGVICTVMSSNNNLDAYAELLVKNDGHIEPETGVFAIMNTDHGPEHLSVADAQALTWLHAEAMGILWMCDDGAEKHLRARLIAAMGRVNFNTAEIIELDEARKINHASGVPDKCRWRSWSIGDKWMVDVDMLTDQPDGSRNWVMVGAALDNSEREALVKASTMAKEFIDGLETKQYG